MADITYPNGTAALQTVVTSGTITATAADNQGTIELGAGNPIDEQAALGLMVYVTYTSGSEAALNLRFAASRDGTTYYQIDAHDVGMSTPVSGTYRYMIWPFTYGEKKVRIQAYAGTPGSTAGTVAIQARLAGIFKVVGISS